jgi:hypothetical protein
MFESELERVRKQLRQQLASQQPYVSMADIHANEQVHPSFRAFFRAEVDWWVHEERAIRSSNPRFATGDPAFREVFRTLDGLYAHFARYDHEELNATIDAAAKTRLNFLCRPRVTLRWFVFRGEPTKPLHEILLRLRYFTDYAYLLQGFEQWARTRGTDSSAFEILSVIEFERIIEKIDNDAILDMSQSQFVALLEPLFEFFATYNPDLPPESVPTEAVIIFLDDKGAVPISQALERLLYREEVRFLTRSKLVDVIEEVLKALEVQPEERHEVPHEVLHEVPHEVRLEERHEERLEERHEERHEVQPEERHEEQHEVQPEERHEEQHEVQPEERHEEQHEVQPEERRTSEPEPDLEPMVERRRKLDALVDDRMREKVIKKLFAKDDAVYAQTTDALLSCATWKEAAGRLDRFYAEHGIEPNSAVAMEFAQAIHRSYL